MQSAGVKQIELEGHGFRFNVFHKPSIGSHGTLVCHHGVGSSAMTFARLFEALALLDEKLGFLAYDMRHHGRTEPLEAQSNDSKGQSIVDLDPETLIDDLCYIMVNTVPSKEPLMLFGHSMGGTLVSRLANDRAALANYNLRGLVVVDAVEGYAKQSLGSMHSLLSLWPSSFASPEEAVKWHLGMGHQLRNRGSAELSVPPLLKLDPATHRYVWKLPLQQTERNWDGWFTNLDDQFIAAPAARLLILAGTGRLDTPLTRAQMQGKFQLMIINESGHYIHEDCPGRVAHCLNDFWIRNGRPLKIIPKFGHIRQD